MRQHYRLAVELTIVLLLAGCGSPRTAQPDIRTETNEVSPPPLLSKTPLQEPHSFPAGEDLSLYMMAMREGHEQDVERFAETARYWLDLTLDIDPLLITGNERVRYYNQTGTGQNEIVFRLYPNILTGTDSTIIHSVSIGGLDADWRLTQHDSTLQILLAETLQPGASLEVEIAFEFILPPDTEVAYGRMIDLDGIIAAPTFFPILAVFEDGDWQTDWPDDKGDPVYSETALYEVQLTAPSSLRLATTGTTIDEQPQLNGTTVYHIVTGPVRDFALAASRDFQVVSETRDGVTINVWSAFATDDAARYTLETGLEAVSALGDYFGEYPYAELDLIESPVSALGIEYPGLVYLADRIWERPAEALSVFEWVIVHEVAHQWWYGVVGDDQINEPWIDEGLAEYSVIVYYDHQVGPETANTVRDRYAGEVDHYVEDEGQRLPVGLPAQVYTDHEYRVFVYSGGAMVHALLGEQFGADNLRVLLSTVYQQYQYRVAHSGDIERLVDEIMGPDAGRLFRDWVYGE